MRADTLLTTEFQIAVINMQISKEDQKVILDLFDLVTMASIIKDYCVNNEPCTGCPFVGKSTTGGCGLKMPETWQY